MMAPLLDRPIQLRHDYDEEEAEDEELVSDEAEVRDGQLESNSDEEPVPGTEESDSGDEGSEGTENRTSSSDINDSDDENEEEVEPSLADVSFGALAKAQETYDPKPRKRKFAETQSTDEPEKTQENEDWFDTRKRAKETQRDAPKRTSKHAPTVESARKPVSRKRVIFEPPSSVKSRDPRFDPTVMSSNRDPTSSTRANKNYSFLSQYQAEEILALKAQIKKAKDPDEVTHLKRQVMSMESKMRSAEARQRENDVRQKHKQKEKEAIRTGQKAKPYFLKEADVRKMAKEERLSSLGKKARDKADRRKTKREKSKQSKDMPRFRRER